MQQNGSDFCGGNDGKDEENLWVFKWIITRKVQDQFIIGIIRQRKQIYFRKSCKSNVLKPVEDWTE